MSTSNPRLNIEDGLALNGTIAMSGSFARLAFRDGNQTLSGDATIAFAGTSGSFRKLSADDGSVVTLAPTVTVEGGTVVVPTYV